MSGGILPRQGVAVFFFYIVGKCFITLFSESTHKNLCALCASKCENPNDEYLGYEGALKCLINTPADVAFTKYVVAKEFFSSRSDRNDFEYLCGTGTSVSIDSNCFWASRPNNFIMTRSGMSNIDLTALKNSILQIFTQFQKDMPAWMLKTLISSNNITSLSEQQVPLVDRLAECKLVNEKRLQLFKIIKCISIQEFVCLFIR